MTKLSVAPLPDRGLVEVRGPDAASFLNDLVTNSVVSLASGEAVYAGLLTPKGKILFDFLIWRRGDDGFLIDVGRAQAPALAQRLGLYRLRAKVEIAERSSELTAGASWGEDERWPDTAGLESYADPRYAPLGRRFVATADFDWPGGNDARAAEQYRQHRIALGVPEGGIDYAYGEAFPHDACYDALNGVDYRKGCYVGQEVVSRMHHRGSAKTRVAMIEAAGPLPLPGTEILAGGTPAGRIGSVDGTRGVAMLRIDRVETAIAAGEPVVAGGVDIAVRTPPWLGADPQAE